MIDQEKYDKLLRENEKLREVIYEIATTAPYGKSFVEAVYTCRKAILSLGLKGSWTDQNMPAASDSTS